MKYTVTAAVTISLSALVEADSEEAALEKAYELGMPQLCHSCVRRQPGVWKLDEIDGDPLDIEVAS